MAERRIGTTLEVVGWNTHNERAAARHLRSLSFDVGAVFEAQKQLGPYRRFPEHDLWTGKPGRPEDLQRETGILMPKGHEVRGHTVEKMSDKVPGEAFARVGKERWGHVCVQKLLGLETAVIAAHPVAGGALARHDATHRIVDAYRDFVDWLEAQLRYQHKQRDREVLFISDIQVRKDAVRPWTPHHLFERHDMLTHWVGIDMMAWTDGFTAVHTEAQKEGLPSDHPLMRARLKRSAA